MKQKIPPGVVVAVLILVFLVIRDILRPSGDVVRMAGDDDPSGGVLEGAEDRWTVPSVTALLARRRVRAGRDGMGEAPADPDDEPTKVGAPT